MANGKKYTKREKVVIGGPIEMGDGRTSRSRKILVRLLIRISE